MKRISTFIVVSIFGLLSVTTVGIEKVEPTSINDKYTKILVNTKVIEALGKIGYPKARGILVEALRSKEFFIRASAAQALGRMQDRASIPLLKKLTEDKNYLVRILATVALFELGQQDAEELLFGFLDDDDPAVRATVIGEVGRLKEHFLPKLHKMLLEEEEVLIRLKLIEQLGEHRFNPALPYIRKALEDENPKIRRVACAALANMKDKKSLPKILERLDDEDTFVRAEAKIALSVLKDKSQIKLFWKEIEDKEPILRTSSYIALAKFGELDILPFLLEEIISADNPTVVRKEVAQSLAILRPYFSEFVNKALVKSRIKCNAMLLENLQVDYKVDGKDLSLIFIEALKDENSPLHHDAPLILKILDYKIALPALREALFKDDPDLLATTAYVLGEFRDEDSVDYLIELFKKYGI